MPTNSALDFGVAVVKRGPLDLQSRPYAKGFAAQPDKMRFKGFSPGIAGYPGFVRQNIHGCARSASTEIGGEVSRRVICQAWARSAKRQTACKPGSVPSATPPRGDLPGVTAIPLGRPSPGASCDRPGQRREGPPGAAAAVTSRRHGTCRPYLVLLPVGFSVPLPLPATRCALTAPFHPCRPMPGLGGVFLWHFPWGRPRRALPGTAPPWSPDFPLPVSRGERPSSRLASSMWRLRDLLSKAIAARR